MAEINVSLSNVLAQALKGRVPALLRVDGGRSISLYPEQQCYVSDITDWESVFDHRVEHVGSDLALRMAPPAHALPLSELHWRSAYYGALAHQSPESASWDLFQLASWPNLSRLPEELVVPVTRICALLWRKPTVGFLVPRVLAMPAPQTLALLAVLSDLGHVVKPRCTGRVAGPDLQSLHDEMHHQTETAASSATKPSSLVSKLWHRLVGR
jgi:hypothetical protein